MDHFILIAILLIALMLALLGFGFALLSPAATGYLLVGCLSLPLFLDASSGSPTLTRLRGGSGEVQTGLHLAIGIATVAFAATIVRGRQTGHALPGRWLIGGLACLYSASLLVGLTAGAGGIGASYYVQTMIPLAVWLVMARSGVSPATVSGVVVVGVAVSLVMVVASGLYVSGGLSGSLATVKTLSSAIPQYRNYFPYIVMCGVVLAISGWGIHPKRSVVTLAMAFIALPLMWSRTGLGMILVGMGVTFFLRPGRTSATTRTLLGTVFAGVIGYFALDRIVAGVIGAREAQAQNLAVSNDTRVNVAREAYERLLHSPLLGDMFVPAQSVTAGGQATTQPILFPAHNQYLDVGLRGGVLAVVLTVVLLIFYGRRAFIGRKASDYGSAALHAGLGGIVAATLIGNLTQLYMIQPWSGGLLFALLGVSSSLPLQRDLAPAPGEHEGRPRSQARATDLSPLGDWT